MRGLNTVMVNRPTRRLSTPIGARNCQADSPPTADNQLVFAVQCDQRGHGREHDDKGHDDMNGILSADSASAVEKL